jgi:hypothetical protein
MRIILAIAIAATFIFAAWWNNPTVADASQTGAVSIDLTSMMSTATDLPTQQYAAF